MQFRFTDETQRAVVAAFEDGRASYDGEIEPSLLYPTRFTVDEAKIEIEYMTTGDAWVSGVEMAVVDNGVPWVVRELLDVFQELKDEIEYSSSVFADVGAGMYLFSLSFD